MVNYLHDQQAAESAVETILAARGTALAVRADVADELNVERLFTETIEAFGGIDAVVHAVVLADELGARGVTVNAVSLVTDRPCAPQRIATVVEYLLRGEGRGLTGRVIRIDEPDGTGPPPFPTVAMQ